MLARDIQEKGPYSSAIAHDPTIGSTVISLFYMNRDDPTRNISIGIAPELGSNLFRFQLGTHDLIYSELALLLQQSFTGNFVLWPLPNRVRDRRYSYQGADYSLKNVQRPGGDSMLIHGLVFDRPWQYEPPVLHTDSISVTTFVEITPESLYYEAYPFDSRLSLTYTLTQDGISITYHVKNNGVKDLPFGFALHPYFATLSGSHDTLVSIPAASVMEADAALLPTGRLLDVDTIMYTMFDLRQPVPVANLKLDHVYTALTPQTAAVIHYRKNGFQLHVSASDDFTHCVIYTPHHDLPFFCLEHQTCATDAINLNNQGPELQKIAHLLEVPPGKSCSGSLHYTLKYNQE